jgi:hypothetical protein
MRMIPIIAQTITGDINDSNMLLVPFPMMNVPEQRSGPDKNDSGVNDSIFPRSAN